MADTKDNAIKNLKLKLDSWKWGRKKNPNTSWLPPHSFEHTFYREYN